QANRSVEQGVEYDLTLWVKSDAPRAFTVNGQKGTPDWTYYGLGGRIQSSTNWEQKTITFQANATVSDFKLQFLLGEETGTIWFDDIEIRKHPPTVLRRDFSNGTVLLNASKDPVSVAVGSGYKRLKGSQAPKHQLILDDQHAGFSTTGAWSLQQYDSGLWKAAGPYYHAWEGSLHESSGGSATASWKLPIEDDDEYVLSAWWPAAPDAGTWSTNVLYEILSGGVVIVRTNFNQRVDGDQWHDLPPVRLNSTNDCYVRVSSDAGGFVADAIQLKSAARYNDGEPVSEVKLQGMDAIILAVDANAKVEPPALSGITIRDGHLVFSVVNLVPGKSYSLQRRNTLAGVGWESIENFEAIGSSMQVLDALPSGQSQYFYRIQVLQ
ncbi:MAG: golvesin C-terminal-like domain-containing protein, partial [Verrucomicrobiota bacterium]